jgi:hypothetical protein
MTKQLNEVLRMINAKMNFFMIKECLESIGFETKSMSMPSLKLEVEHLVANAELEEESNTLVIL